MNRSLDAIYELLVKLLGECSLSNAQKIDEIFAAHSDFWFDEEADRRLRNALYPEAQRLTGDDGNLNINLTDAMIRDQAGLPPREDDIDPVYADYRIRAGDILIYEDNVTEIRIIGPCPSSPFCWAAVESLSDKVQWLMSWIVIQELTVKQRP